MGTDFFWDRGSSEISLVLFVNTADPTGVSIRNLEADDVVNVTEMAGMASFDADKGNTKPYSIAAVILATGEAIAEVTDYGPFRGPINELEDIARQAFGADKMLGKVRDAFGVSESGGHKARQEGGILVTLPGAMGPYTSGEDEKLWIQGDGERTDQNRPAHVEFGFFPTRDANHNRRAVGGRGALFVTAWDWRYTDNAGFYKVFMTITAGNAGTLPNSR